MKEYTDDGCIDFVNAAFKKCLVKTRSKEDIANRLNFVNNTAIFKLWCVATDQNEARLRNLVLIRNHKFIKELE